MKKSIVLITTLLMQSIIGMQQSQPMDIEITKQSQYPSLPIEIIGKVYIDLFKTPGVTEPASMVQKKIQTICLINKDLRNYICCPNNICTIINNATLCHPFLKSNLAHCIKTPAVQNYLQQSQSLNTNIQVLTADQIRNLIFAGADINYCCFDKTKTICRPILFKTISDYDKTQLLLELGANPHERDILDNGKSSAFEQAMRKENIGIVNLFIQYCPHYHNSGTSIDIALDTKNTTLIKSVLNQKNIPFEALKKVLFYAHDEKITELIKLLYDRGIALYEGD